MAIEQLKVREIVQRAVEKKLDIPEFQREFAWDPEQVKLLAESLCRGYPVGSFLLWDSSEYQESKSAEGPASQWIVDGQQRTTALCLLMGMKPYWWPDTYDWNKALKRYDVMVNTLPSGEGDRLGFALPNPIRKQDPRWVCVRRVLSAKEPQDLTELAREIVSNITGSPQEANSVFKRVFSNLQKLWQVREQEIPLN